VHVVTGSIVYFDPYDVEINADPYPTYERLREESPLYHNERYDFWALARHEDVQKALVNWEVFSSSRGDLLDVLRAGIDVPTGVVMWEDPPVHTAHRSLLSRVFTPKRMALLEDQVREYCVRCLDPLIGTDGFDVITELASMLPMRVIGMLLGIPEEDQVAVRDKTDRDLRTRPGQPMRISQSAVVMGEMFADYVEWRSHHPSDDLMTMLLNAEFEDETGATRTLTRQEVLTYTSVLAGAGNETTGRLIGWLAKILAEHPDQRRRVVEDRSLIPGAIEETLRFEPTGHASARYVMTDTEYYGTTLPAGSAVLLLMASANRDPRRFEAPDRYDITRSEGQHTTFGYGLHFCLGAHLARLEGRVALDEFLNRWPEWDIDYEGSKLASTSTVRGWEKLPIVVR
jgi:cytochrome P450